MTKPAAPNPLSLPPVEQGGFGDFDDPTRTAVVTPANAVPEIVSNGTMTGVLFLALVAFFAFRSFAK